MGGGYFINPIIFVIEFVLGFYLIAAILRFQLQCVRADFYNPIAQFLVKLTNPLLVPLRRIVPGVAGVDVASIVLILAVALTEAIIVNLLRGYSMSVTILLAQVMLAVVTSVFYIYLASLILQVVISWVAPHQYSPLAALVYQLNNPLLKPIRKRLPPIGGLDFSVMVLWLIIIVLMMYLLPLLKSLIR